MLQETMLETSYSPALYSPASQHMWSTAAAAAAAGPKSLGWKVSGPPPSRHDVTQPTAGASMPPRQAASSVRRSGAATATAGTPNAAAVLGSGVAGYTSVITRSPITPSGYSVPVRPNQTAAAEKQQQRQQQFQQQASNSMARRNENPINSRVSCIPSSAQTLPCSAAAAAAGALAALAGSHARAGSASAVVSRVSATAAVARGGSSSCVQQYAADNYAAVPPASANTSGRSSMLMWNIRQPPPTGLQPGSLVAGRRAAPAVSTAGQLNSSSISTFGYSPSEYHGGSNNSNSSSRPPSQEAGSPGLAKLKQLSTARLVRRLGTPPAATYGSADSAGRCSGPDTTYTRDAPLLYNHQPQQQQQQQHVLAPKQLQPQKAAANGAVPPGAAAPIPGSSTTTSNNRGASMQAAVSAAAEVVDIERQPCPNCGRGFAPAALQQHTRICHKVFSQKRKVFDVRAQRLAGTGAAPAAAAGKQRGGSATGRSCRGGQQAAADKRPAVSAAQAKKAKWLMQSEQLRAAMRSTRPQAAGGAEGWGGAAAQVEEVADTRVPCPHCGRRFAELVAERHIPKCRDIIAKPSRLKAAGGRSAYMRSDSRGSR